MQRLYTHSYSQLWECSTILYLAASNVQQGFNGPLLLLTLAFQTYSSKLFMYNRTPCIFCGRNLPLKSISKAHQQVSIASAE